MNAILYILATGCQWRALPKDFPPRSTVQGYFYLWRDSGLWRRINRLGCVRPPGHGTQAVPSAGVIDSQSVKTTESGGPRGFDAAKRIKGRKRHMVTDTQGFLLASLVHAANIQDNHGAVPLLVALDAVPKLRHIFADRVYRGDKLREPSPSPAVDDRDRHPLRERRDVQARTQTMGDRTHLRLVRTKPPPRQGLRANHRQRRGLVLIASVRLLSRRLGKTINAKGIL